MISGRCFILVWFDSFFSFPASSHNQTNSRNNQGHAEGHAQRHGLAQHRYTQNHCGERLQGTQNGGRGAAYEEYRCCGADE